MTARNARTNDAAWTRTAELVLAYVEAERRFPPYGYQDPDGIKLGVWLNNQRAYSRDGSHRPLAAHRRAWLDEHLPGWDARNKAWPGNRNEIWSRNLERYEASVRAADATLPPSEAVAGGVDLRSWIAVQRQSLRDGTLPPDRKAALDERVPGWSASSCSRRDRWARAMRQYEDHFRRTGSVVPDADARLEDGVELRTWLWTQRRHLRRGALSSERKAALDERVPGWSAWTCSHADRWARAMRQYEDHFRRTGSVVPDADARLEDGVDLRAWLWTQRRALRRGTLSSERKAALDERVPGWSAWTCSHADRWARAMRQYEDHFRRTGSVVPDADARLEDGVDLRAWLGTQRRNLRRGTLSPERKAALDERVPGWSESDRRPNSSKGDSHRHAPSAARADAAARTREATLQP